jgi:hypothetical protein
MVAVDDILRPVRVIGIFVSIMPVPGREPAFATEKLGLNYMPEQHNSTAAQHSTAQRSTTHVWLAGAAAAHIEIKGAHTPREKVKVPVPKPMFVRLYTIPLPATKPPQNATAQMRAQLSVCLFVVCCANHTLQKESACAGVGSICRRPKRSGVTAHREGEESGRRRRRSVSNIESYSECRVQR